MGRRAEAHLSQETIMILKNILAITLLFSVAVPNSSAVEDKVELETTFIKGNKELPQVLYVVPWKDMKKERHKEEIIVLHSLFGDLFDPVGPDEFRSSRD